MKRWFWIVSGITCMAALWTAGGRPTRWCCATARAFPGRSSACATACSSSRKTGATAGASSASSRWTCAPSSSIRTGPAAFEQQRRACRARPRGLREREVTVSARQPWTDTGVTIRNGQTVYFEASGRIRWGRERQDGPEGENDSPRNPNRPIAVAAGRGAHRPCRRRCARSSSAPTPRAFACAGPVSSFLGVNDETFEDNSGSFRVTVYY